MRGVPCLDRGLPACVTLPLPFSQVQVIARPATHTGSNPAHRIDLTGDLDGRARWGAGHVLAGGVKAAAAPSP